MERGDAAATRSGWRPRSPAESAIFDTLCAGCSRRADQLAKQALLRYDHVNGCR
jgi:hypothetical protein